jgi:hypothetical protein
MDIITSLFKQRGKASLVIDKEGLMRMEGLITKVEENNNNIGETMIHLPIILF